MGDRCKKCKYHFYFDVGFDVQLMLCQKCVCRFVHFACWFCEEQYESDLQFVPVPLKAYAYIHRNKSEPIYWFCWKCCHYPKRRRQIRVIRQMWSDGNRLPFRQL